MPYMPTAYIFPFIKLPVSCIESLLAPPDYYTVLIYVRKSTASENERFSNFFSSLAVRVILRRDSRAVFKTMRKCEIRVVYTMQSEF